MSSMHVLFCDNACDISNGGWNFLWLGESCAQLIENDVPTHLSFLFMS